jgi:hypothetical protein
VTGARIGGILLLYHRYLSSDAATVLENIRAFERHSRFPVVEVNTDAGFPPSLAGTRFSAVVLHYSLFSPRGYYLDDRFRGYLSESDAYKIAFFQDEHHYCRQRFAFLDRHGIDCVYSMLEPNQVAAVYGAHTRVSDVVTHLPGYVSDELVAAARRFARPDEQRTVDIGYRGRALAPYMGRGALEKYEIGIRFREVASGAGLALDIRCDEADRIYGNDWSRFTGNCHAVLGTESGVTVFDLDDRVRLEYEALAAADPGMTSAEYFERRREDREGEIHYRTASPRHFEAAAFRTAQILYEGRYSGVMEPWVHYIPLRKDFSNLDEAIGAFRDRTLRAELVENAHRDLIASGAYGYARFVAGFDDRLGGLGLRPDGDPAAAIRARRQFAREVRRSYPRRRLRLLAGTVARRRFPGRDRLAGPLGPALAPAVDRLRGWVDPAGRRGEPEA